MTRIGVVICLGIAFGGFAFAFAPHPPAGASGPGLQATPVVFVNECVEVAVGDEFPFTIKAQGVSNLLAWEVYFAYNRHLLEVVSKDVQQLLNTGREPNVVDVSDPVPNFTGFYRMGAADLGPGGLKQGDVLVRLTLKAKSEGVSPSKIYRGDYNGDGSIDFGPTLTGPGPQYIGDADGDQRYDGAISSGQIAVGTGCVQPAPELQPGESVVAPSAPDSQPETGPGEGQNPARDGGSDPNEGPGTNDDTQQDTQPSPASLLGEPDQSGDSENSSGGGITGDPRSNPRTNDGGIGGGLVPWVLIGLGMAGAAAGGITFYMIRMASRDPY